MIKTQEKLLKFDILQFIKKGSSPVGAGSIQRYLNAKGYSLAEATVGRLLREMDDQGYTKKQKNKGRVLSESGETMFKELEQKQWQYKWTEEFIKVVDKTKQERLFDLLVARRPVEMEVARLAATNATDKDITALRYLVEEQEQLAKEGKSVSHIDTEFHRLLAKASRNQILEAVVELLRKKQEDAIEFENIRRKTGHIYNTEHRKIFEAIELKDSDMAVLAMKRHLDNLLQMLKKHNH